MFIFAICVSQFGTQNRKIIQLHAPVWVKTPAGKHASHWLKILVCGW